MMTAYHISRIALKILFGFSLLISGASAQVISLGPYETMPGSRLWIEGSSNINKFTCASQTLVGYAYFGAEKMLLPASRFVSVKSNTELYFSIPVETFDCGKKRMNKDMYEALKEEQFPVIAYEMTESRLLTTPDTVGDWYRVRASGILTLAGTSQEMEMTIKIRALDNGNYQVTGAIPVSMHDFSIKPPSAFFGMIKAKADLTVHFDLIVDAKQTEQQTRRFENQAK